MAELDKILNSDSENEGFETEDVTVTISAIKPEDIAKKNFLGFRKVEQSESEEESEREVSDVETKEIPGMEIKKKKQTSAISDKSFQKMTEKLKSEKDVKKMVSLLNSLVAPRPLKPFWYFRSRSKRRRR